MGKFQELCENAGHTCRSYSGRGMYGRYCLGVDLDRRTGFGEFAADVIAEARTEGNADAAFDAIEEAFRNTCQDAMGLGTIFYWTGISYDGGEHGECEECGKRISDADVGAYRANGGTGCPAVCDDCAEELDCDEHAA